VIGGLGARAGGLRGRERKGKGLWTSWRAGESEGVPWELETSIPQEESVECKRGVEDEQ